MTSSTAPRPKCFSCGKDLPTREELRLTGKTNVKLQMWFLCPDCGEKALRLQIDFGTRWLEHKLYGKPKPDIDAFMTEKRTELDALKIPDWFWRWWLLHRVQSTYERGA